MIAARELFSYRKYWAHRFGTAPFLPMSQAEMDELGWDSCDVILVTGDAYIDHPSFGMAMVGRFLEAQGFRVGIISQPDWTSAIDFQRLGRPNLFFGVTAGNMDSMVNRYTAERRIRRDDAYTAGGEGGKRPDRSVIVYSQRCREAYGDVPLIIGGIEASLRRIAHFDYWSEKVRRSVLLDAKADLLLYGNAERALAEVAHRLAKGEPISEINDVRGTAFLRSVMPEGWHEIDASTLDSSNAMPVAVDPYQAQEVKPCQPAAAQPVMLQGKKPRLARGHSVVRLPAYEQVRDDPLLYAKASRVFHLETNPGNARALVQRHGDRDVWLNPPSIPLSTKEMDAIFDLPFARAPHPSYGAARLSAWEMIRFSINIMRGCFGGCTFCSITEHEGRIVQNRSEDSIVREVEAIRDQVAGFTGVISDLGGPTANMYRMRCKDARIESACRRLSCVFPDVCINMATDHGPLVNVYRRVRELPGIKRVLIASGLRYDLAVRSPEYIKELVAHHVGGYLKIAPEHTEAGPLALMMKPGMGAYDRFKQLFEQISKDVGKEQYLIPYFIAAHPGTRDEDMLELALWLKRNGFRLDQVQNFLPTPLALATAMYHSQHSPLKRVSEDNQLIEVPKGARQRRLHKAFLRYHDAENWPLLREALQRMGRADLIGNAKRHLVPAWQPADTGSRSSKPYAIHAKKENARQKPVGRRR